jgi:hypothetical protein
VLKVFAQAGLKPSILLPHLVSSWDYRQMPPCPGLYQSLRKRALSSPHTLHRKLQLWGKYSSQLPEVPQPTSFGLPTIRFNQISPFKCHLSWVPIATETNQHYTVIIYCVNQMEHKVHFPLVRTARTKERSGRKQRIKWHSNPECQIINHWVKTNHKYHRQFFMELQVSHNRTWETSYAPYMHTNY